MTATLSISEIIQEKKIVEKAIAKLLQDLQEQTGCLVHGVSLTKIIGAKDSKIITSINIDY